MSGLVVLPHDPDTGFFCLKDEKGRFHTPSTQRMAKPPRLHVGDYIRTSTEKDTVDGRNYEFCKNVTILKRVAPPDIPLRTAAAVNISPHKHKIMRIQGVVQDAFRDECDKLWTFLIIKGEDGSFPFAATAPHKDSLALAEYIGSTVEVSGIQTDESGRTEPILYASSLNSVRILSHRTESIFDAPEINALYNKKPAEIVISDRHRASGSVLALWDDRHILLQTAPDSVCTVEMAADTQPEVGEQIDVVGFPTTDLFTINLKRAFWRCAAIRKQPVPEQKASSVNGDYLLQNVRGDPEIKAKQHGHLLRVSGILRQKPPPTKNFGKLYLDCNGQLLTVSLCTSSDVVDNVKLGSLISVTGICVIEKDEWHSESSFPQVRGIQLVIRHPEDVVVLRGPSLLSTTNLIITVAILFTLLVGILVWNLTLRKLVARKGYALFKEQVRKLEAELRIDERTRLATELHDSVAQDLAGVTMQVETACNLIDATETGPKAILLTASAMLQSCREELRICLWNLRNGALDEKTMNSAIFLTISPLLNGATASIRFNAARSNISDATTHTVLRIIRELVSNSIRHGHATAIRIAGTLEGKRLLFSVTDNGCGFNVDTVPNAALGHFGLNGIRERVRKFNGSILIKSTIGSGTKTIISL